MTRHPYVATIRRRAEEIAPLLAGLPPDVQSAVLGQLVATWLQGHTFEPPRDAAAVRAMREELFGTWQILVWDLVEARDKYEEARRERSRR
jgi:hypothetical protein